MDMNWDLISTAAIVMLVLCGIAGISMILGDIRDLQKQIRLQNEKIREFEKVTNAKIDGIVDAQYAMQEELSRKEDRWDAGKDIQVCEDWDESK